MMMVKCLHSIDWTPICRSGHQITEVGFFTYAVQGQYYMVSDIIPVGKPLELPYDLLRPDTPDRSECRRRLRTILTAEVQKRDGN